MSEVKVSTKNVPAQMSKIRLNRMYTSLRRGEKALEELLKRYNEYKPTPYWLDSEVRYKQAKSDLKELRKFMSRYDTMIRGEK